MQEDNQFNLGYFDTPEEAALAYDRAMLIINPDIPREELNFDPDESEHVTFSPEVLRQIHAIRDGKGWIA
jgi:hypothetical protein